MFTISALAAAYAGWRIARAVLQVLHRLPRSNDDMIFF